MHPPPLSLPLSLPSDRYDAAIKDIEKKQETIAAKLSTLQQDYQQCLMKAGMSR